MRTHADSFHTPNSGLDDRRQLQEPISDRLYLAGEVVAINNPATVHGAVLSRQSAAGEPMRRRGLRLLLAVAHFVGRRPRLARLVSGERSSHPADLDVVGLLAGTGFAIGMFLSQVVKLVDGGFVVRDE